MWRTTHMWFEGNERLKKNGEEDDEDDDDKEDTKKKASSAADFQSLVHLKSLFGNRFSVAQCPRGSTRDKMLNTAVLSMPLRNRESRTTLFEDLNCMHGNDDNMIRFDGKSEDSNRVCCDIYFCGNVSTMSKPYVIFEREAREFQLYLSLTLSLPHIYLFLSNLIMTKYSTRTPTQVRCDGMDR